MKFIYFWHNGVAMKPVKFKEQNYTLLGTNYEGVADLPCYLDDEHVISCWRGGLVDRVRFLFTGKVWFWAKGHTHPPILLSTEYPWRAKEAL